MKNIFLIGLCVLTLPGCYFGNRSKTTLKGYDTISGFYTSLPQTVTFEATIGNAPKRSKSGTINDIPEILKAIMANPTMLYFDDPIEGIGSIRSHLDSSTGFPTYIEDAAGTFGASISSGGQVPGCLLSKNVVTSGTFAQLPATQTLSGFTVRGSLSLDYTHTVFLTGEDIDCNPLRARIQSCYTDGVGCSTDPNSVLNRTFLKEAFDPCVNIGLITSAEISAFKSVSYHATYE